jgi:hypothetical protein
VAPVDQLNVYGVEPPLTFTVLVPLLAPKQGIVELVKDKIGEEQTKVAITACVETVQLLASVTVTV